MTAAMTSKLSALAAALVMFSALSVSAQTRQTQEDDYTRYELLAPDTRFRC
jgi:hypothetical protein